MQIFQQRRDIVHVAALGDRQFLKVNLAPVNFFEDIARRERLIKKVLAGLKCRFGMQRAPRSGRRRGADHSFVLQTIGKLFGGRAPFQLDKNAAGISGW